MHKQMTQPRKIISAVFAVGFVMASCLAVTVFAQTSVEAVNVIKSTNQGPLADANSQNIENSGAIENIVNILFFVVGVAAVIAIIIGGIRYTTSNGDASQTKAAKDTVLYAVVGLIVALMAWAIVSFVVSWF